MANFPLLLINHRLFYHGEFNLEDNSFATNDGEISPKEDEIAQFVPSCSLLKGADTIGLKVIDLLPQAPSVKKTTESFYANGRRIKTIHNSQ